MARELTICAVGDFCPQPREGEAVETLFAGVDDLLGAAHLRIVNVEFPLVTRRRPIVKSGPALSETPSVVKLLKGRFDIGLLANNHILDHGPQAVLDTIRGLRAQGLRTVGAGATHAQAERPLLLNAQGFSIALLNACEHEFGVAGPDSAGGAGLRPFHLIRSIMALRAKHDIVLVFTHGGNEMNPLPSPRVVAMNRAFAEAGASVVINTHPHVPQAMEVWKGTPIAYSLGNFVFDWHGLDLTRQPMLWWTGMAAQLHFTEAKGRIHASLRPTFTRLDPEAGRLEMVRGKARASLLAWLRQISRVLRDEQLLQEYFDAWTTVHGAAYAGGLGRHASDVNTPEGQRQYAGFRNLLTCEAHNELMTNYARLRLDKRLGRAEARLGTLQKWMAGELAG